MKLARYAIAALVLAAAVPGAPAQAEDLVVVAARGIGLHPGARVDPSKPLVLKEGQHLTLIALNGVTLKLDGPYDKPPALAQGGSDLSSALQALVTQTGARTAEAGVTRAGASVAVLPSPWLIDVSRPGNVCLVDGQRAEFWRPSAAASETLTVWPVDRSWKGEAVWPAGSNRLVEPDDFAVHANAIYLVALGKGEASAITVNAVPRDLASDAMRAAWLAQKGCEAQAEAIARQAQK
jgi:hypothetical protein